MKDKTIMKLGMALGKASAEIPVVREATICGALAVGCAHATRRMAETMLALNTQSTWGFMNHCAGRHKKEK